MGYIMCGIAAIIGDITPEDKTNIQNMVSAQLHRGPDGNNIFEANKAFLGHARLKIIDLSDRAEQPMKSNNNRYIITFNGEIYNYIELKNQLKISYKFKTTSDTEVLLAAWEVWGEKCLDYISGMYAFCIYDTQEEKTFMARDPMGQKPLYYTIHNNRLILSSEVKAILSTGIKSIPNTKVWHRYITTATYDDTSETYFKNIDQLLPGECATFDIKNGFKKKRYYRLSEKYNLSKDDFNESVIKVKESIIKACDIHMRSDVPIALMLSGGIDSSAMLAALHMANKLSNVSCFSVDFGKDFTEEPWIKAAAQHYGSKYYIDTFTEEDFKASITQTIWHLEGPAGGLMNCAFIKVMDRALRTNTPVLLDGSGGDECFGGYKNHHNLYLGGELKNNTLSSEKALKEYMQVWGVNEGYARKAAEFELSNINSLYTSIDGTVPVKNEALNKIFLDQKLLPSASNGNTGDVLKDSMIQYLQGSKIPRNMRMMDRISMAYGIELRLPFLDTQLVELGLNLPSSFYFHNGYTKGIIREAFKGVMPDDVRLSTKRSIQAPQGLWLRKDPMRKYVYDLINSDSFKDRGIFNSKTCNSLFENFCKGKFSNSFFVWQWINVEEWFRTFIDNDANNIKHNLNI